MRREEGETGSRRAQGAGFFEGLEMTMRNNKDRLHLSALRCREYENKQPPLRGLQGDRGSRPEEEETFQEEFESRGVC